MINRPKSYDKPMHYTVPSWLYILEKGEYTLEQIQEKIEDSGSKKSKTAIYGRISQLKVESKSVNINGYHRKLFKWEGAEYYLHKKLETECDKIPFIAKKIKEDLNG